jgi:hypothetical protein
VDTPWFAIQTKPGGEELASLYISNLGLVRSCYPGPCRWHCGMGIEGLRNFVPRLSVRAFLSGKLLSLGAVRSRCTPCSLRRRLAPLPVDGEIIRVIRDRVSSQQSPETESSDIRLGEEVVVRAGALEGLCGIFEGRISNRGRVLLLLNAIHYQAGVLIDSRSLKLAAQAG